MRKRDSTAREHVTSFPTVGGAESGGGDKSTLGARCEALAPALYGWAVLRIPSSLRARLEPEDVVQEVFCRILARGDEFDPARGDFRAWAFGFARHVLHEGLRNCARDEPGHERLGFTELSLVPEHATTLTRRVARAEILRNFAERVGGLESEERKLLLLRGLEGLEHEAVARELRISSEACAKRWQRLRERLGGEFDVLLSA
ncbi:MAG: sigma-70 family RNA polymerase sigma factor [Planctomycetes bacterium]|nr:sigma-70 family RNA polymerase sigma factor [Planctomycetota bacterium]